MKKPNYRPITTAEFKAAAAHDELESLEAQEAGDGTTQVLVNRKALPAETFYLTTRRKAATEKVPPRVFKDATRMLRLLGDAFSGEITFTRGKKKRASK